MKLQCKCGHEFEADVKVGHITKCPNCSDIFTVKDFNSSKTKQVVSRKKNKNNRDIISDFLSFRVFISTSIIQIVYLLGAIGITLFGIVGYDKGFFYRYNANKSIFILILLIIIANVIWRLLCEVTIIFFSMHEILASIERNLEDDE